MRDILQIIFTIFFGAQGETFEDNLNRNVFRRIAGVLLLVLIIVLVVCGVALVINL